MPVSSPSSSSRTFVAIGTGALLVLVVIVITGGFVIEAGSFRLSSRRVTTPLLIALVAWTAAALHGRSRLSDALASLTRFLERHATAAAIVLAAAAAGTGVAYGTYAASGADAAGYVSQATLIASGRISIGEPLTTQVGWPDAAWTFSPFGYRPGVAPNELVPTYASGLPLVMAAATRIGGPLAAYLVVPLFGALAVLGCHALAAALHSRTAGLVAAALMATSPIFLFQLVQPMSDVPVAALWALALLFATLRIPGAPLAAGAAAGFAVLVRPNLLPLAAVIAVAAAGWPFAAPAGRRAAVARLAAFVAGLLPAIGAQALLQWRLYGNPIASGYGALSEIYVLSNVWPNVRGYGLRLVSGEPAAIVLALASLGVMLLTRSLGPRTPAVKPLALRAAGASAVVLICYLAYGVFAEWSYLRFLLPALPPTFALVGALVAGALLKAPAPLRGLALLLLVVAVGATNVRVAAREQAFNLQQFESRYRTAGRYLESALPPEAVIVSVQESASARHYARRPILRWDLLAADLDATVAALTALGRRPVFLVEDWEAADLRRRFPASPLARLDWTPRADFGTSTRARLFDPADRSGPSPVTDRVP